MSFLAAYIMRGRLQAMLVASTLALLSLLFPPVSIVSSAAVSLITLRKGAYEGLVVLLTSSVAAAVLGVFVIGNYQFALGYTLILWLPVWLISIVLREGRSLSLALEIAVWLGSLAALGVYLVNPEIAETWRNILHTMAAAMGQNAEVPSEKIEQLKQVMDVYAHYMTGIMAASSVSSLMLGLLLARWWQAVLYYPGGFKQEFLALYTGPAIAFATLAVVALGLLGGGAWAEAAWNIAVILLVLYSFIGTAVVHVLLSAMRAKRFLLPAFYLSLLIIPQILLPVALVGIGDTWLDLRKQRSN
ncbi:MAG: DUF2232 domain-containing protein [Gammaproteobacteria bacterium]